MLEQIRRRRRTVGYVSDSLSESYRIMRNNLLVAVDDISHPSVLVTSARPGEGKTSTVANLATVLAVAGRRVVAVDFDLRNPGLHRAVGLPNERGVTDVLRGDAAIEDCTQFVEVVSSSAKPGTGMYVLTSGPVPADPAELVAGKRAASLIRVLSEQSDIVIIDSPPVLAVADSQSLARLVSGVVLVVEARKTPIPVVQQAQSALVRSQARLLGVVVSKVLPQDSAGTESAGPVDITA